MSTKITREKLNQIFKELDKKIVEAKNAFLYECYNDNYCEISRLELESNIFSLIAKRDFYLSEKLKDYNTSINFINEFLKLQVSYLIESKKLKNDNLIDSSIIEDIKIRISKIKNILDVKLLKMEKSKYNQYYKYTE